MMRKAIEKFFHSETAGGILLMLATILALLIANSAAKPYYDLLLSLAVEVRIGALEIAKPLLLWINDGLMAAFFFVVGLELKRELLEGELSNRDSVVLPLIGAVGGMVLPALIYVAFNYQDPAAIQGWAIPAATDIAFAIGVLALLGDRIPSALKLFLVSLAIFDDVGAILIIAIFYTDNLSLGALAISLACLPPLLLLNRFGVTRFAPYIFFGSIMWVAILKSGVHATLAGVVLAMFIPLRDPENPEVSPLRVLEHDLHGVVSFVILPIFAFANAGIPLKGLGLDALLHPVPLGIAAGLFVGKQVGIFGFCWVAVKIGLARLPQAINWVGLYGAAVVCGIGFTMSLFIGSLAFEDTQVDYFFDERLGIILGSLFSGILGYVVLRRLAPKSAESER